MHPTFKLALIFFLLLSVTYSFGAYSSIPKNSLIKLRFSKEDKQYYKKLKWNPKKTALIVVDMWDRHHCIPSEKRVVSLAKKLKYLLPLLHNSGVQIIFAPSGKVAFYANTSNRKKTILLSGGDKTFEKDLDWLSSFENEPSMPVETSCENEKQNFKNRSWSHQIDILRIRKNDLISENGKEIINILRNQKINLVLYAGVHSNVCVVSQPFGMRNLKSQGFQVVLIRDLTDSYTAKSSQFPSQIERNKAIINHIETYIAPTIHSNQLKSEFDTYLL